MATCRAFAPRAASRAHCCDFARWMGGLGLVGELHACRAAEAFWWPLLISAGFWSSDAAMTSARAVGKICNQFVAKRDDNR